MAVEARAINRDVALMNISSADELLALLKDHPDRMVYFAASGRGWFISRMKIGLVPESFVNELVARGDIHSCYSSIPHEAYHVGKTLDIEATKSERLKHSKGSDAPKIYTDGSWSYR